MLGSVVITRWCLVIQCHVFIVCALTFLLNVVRGTPGVVWRRLSLCHDVCDCLAHCMGAVKRYQFDALLSLALVLERTLATSASCGRSPPPGVCDHYNSRVGLVHFGFGADWINFSLLMRCSRWLWFWSGRLQLVHLVVALPRLGCVITTIQVSVSFASVLEWTGSNCVMNALLRTVLSDM